MSHIEKMKDVPDSRVAEVIAMLKASGGTNIKQTKQADGLWTIEATFDP